MCKFLKTDAEELIFLRIRALSNEFFTGVKWNNDNESIWIAELEMWVAVKWVSLDSIQRKSCYVETALFGL